MTDFIRPQDIVRPAVAPQVAPAKVVQRKLSEINLEQEFDETLVKSKQLYETVEFDNSVPPAEKARILASIASVLDKITRQRVAIHTAEKFQQVEAALLQALRTLPIETAQEFLRQYEQIYKDAEAK